MKFCNHFYFLTRDGMDDHRSDFADNSREIREEVKKWPFFTQPNRIMLELFFLKIIL